MQQTKQSNGVGLALHRRGGEGEGGGSIAKQATGRRAKSSAATHPPPPCLLRLGRAHRWGRWRSEARRDPPLRGEPTDGVDGDPRSEARRDPPLRGEPFVPTSRCPRVWRYSPPRRRHAPSGAKERGREGSRGWEGGEVRVAAGCKGFPHIDRSAITPPLHSPCARHVRRESSGVVCHWERRNDARHQTQLCHS